MRRFCPGPLEPEAPYAERADVSVGRLDAATLQLWGGLSARASSAVTRRPLVDLVRRVERQEEEIRRLSEAALRCAADDLRASLARRPGDWNSIGRAFALTREAADRILGKRHYAVQMLGGAAMMQGAIAEMQTGEGKTLTALLPAVAAALSNRPVHVITVNDYLARRDAEHLRPIYEALGITVGLAGGGQERHERRAGYACDVTYCTNKDLVFDYLRDRLALKDRRNRARLRLDGVFSGRKSEDAALLLRGLHFAIVDEADSIMIDEARTPLILAGGDPNGAGETDVYLTALEIARGLTLSNDFTISGDRALRITECGEISLTNQTKEMGGLWRIRRARNELVHQALSALHLFQRDADYIVADGKVQIVDKNTGRVMPDRSWERGLHQTIEAKEECAFTERRTTLAGITYQRFFGRYLHLCGMTGTAMEAAGELRAIYGLKVVRIPTHRPPQRRNAGTKLFTDADQKWRAVVQSVEKLVRSDRAVLVGTNSVATSEMVGARLREAGLDVAILNAKNDRAEAETVGQAGQPGRVTVATNMAGRGTDIILHPAVKATGGLHVILTEYHESSRIDRQLFGRAGRQGDPGSVECIVSLQDEFFSRFAGHQISRLMGAIRLQMPAQVSQAVCLLLKTLCQKVIEHRHAADRKRAFFDDQNALRTLSFAGIRE